MSELVPLGGDRRPPARKLATFVMVDEPRSSAQASPEGMGLREALGILRRRLWLIILFTTIGGGLGYFLAQRQAPVYSARAVIRVQDPTTQMGGQLAAQSYAWALTDPVRSTLEVLKSQSVLGGIVDRTSIRLVSLDPDFTVSSLERVRVNEFAQMDTIQLTFDAAGVEAASMRTGARARATYDSTLDLGAISFTARRPPPGAPPVVRMALRDRQQAISTVDSGLNAVLRPQTNVVDVDFTAADAYLAQQVVNEAVSVFEEQSTLDARQVVTRRRSFLEVQLAEADTILRISQQALSEFRTRAQVFSSQQRAVAQQSGLMSVEVREEELRADRQMYVALLDGLRAAPTDGEASERLQSLIAVPDLAQNPLISSLSSQLLDYELEREALTSGPWAASTQNPDIVRLDQLIRSTHERLEVAIQSHIQQLDARAAALAGLRDRTAGQITGLPEAEAEEARYLQEVEASRRTVEQLREELYRAQLAEAIELGPVNVLDLAPLPTGSQRASLPVMIALGILLGGLAGTSGAFLSELLNTKIRGREDVEKSLRVHVLGVIPKLPALSRLMKKRARERGAQKAGAAASNGRPPATALVTLMDIRSHQAEAFRTLRTNLLFARDGDEVRTLVVTSALPEEGKTTTAANLAVTYAQQGLRVLLVDCDLRKPRVAKLLQLDPKPGLTHVVFNQLLWDEAVQEYGPVEGLSVLTAGTLPPNPTELLGGARMRALLSVVRERFDVVILDTPPLSGGADAAILGAACDGVLMVVRTGETHQQAARLAGQQLATVGARLVGAVLNDPKGKMPKYGEYGYSGYYGGG